MKKIISLERDLKMDFLKGILVVGMVLCHAIQFFVPVELYPIAEKITWYANAITFSAFIFTFGYTNSIAYYKKDFKLSYKKMLINAFKILIVYYISAFAYKLFVDKEVLDLRLIKKLLIFNEIPGWSEFIISFSLIMFIGLLLFPLFKNLQNRPKLTLAIAVILLGSTYIPYSLVKSNFLGLFIGTTNFSVFPVLQYLPFYLIGIYFCNKKVEFNIIIFIISLLLTAITFIITINKNWVLPERFPPELIWIILPSFPIYLNYLLSRLIIDKLKLTKNIISSELLNIGKNTLFFLIVSNILIFSISGVDVVSDLNTILVIIFTFILFLVIRVLQFLVIRPIK